MRDVRRPADAGRMFLSRKPKIKSALSHALLKVIFFAIAKSDIAP